ncbi:nickel insertion protein, partial [Acinetobacter baumannii]
MKILYFDCFSGVSGNMILGALIAAGVDPESLKRDLKKLELPDFDLVAERTTRSGIAGIHVSVSVPDEKKHRHLPEIERIIDSGDL